MARGRGRGRGRGNTIKTPTERAIIKAKVAVTRERNMLLANMKPDSNIPDEIMAADNDILEAYLRKYNLLYTESEETEQEEDSNEDSQIQDKDGQIQHEDFPNPLAYPAAQDNGDQEEESHQVDNDVEEDIEYEETEFQKMLNRDIDNGFTAGGFTQDELNTYEGNLEFDGQEPTFNCQLTSRKEAKGTEPAVEPVYQWFTQTQVFLWCMTRKKNVNTNRIFSMFVNEEMVYNKVELQKPGEILNLAKTVNQTAFLIQMFGEKKARKDGCSICIGGKMTYAFCTTIPGILQGSCGSCCHGSGATGCDARLVKNAVARTSANPIKIQQNSPAPPTTPVQQTSQDLDYNSYFNFYLAEEIPAVLTNLGIPLVPAAASKGRIGRKNTAMPATPTLAQKPVVFAQPATSTSKKAPVSQPVKKSHAESSGAVHDHDQVAEILSSDLTQNRTDILAEVQEFRAHAVQAAASATRLMKLLDTFEKSSKISHTPKVKARETAGPPSVASPSTSKPPVQSGPAVLVENRQLSSVGKGKRKAEEPVVNARRSARHTVSNLDGTDERAAKRQHTASSSRGGTPRRRGHGGRMK